MDELYLKPFIRQSEMENFTPEFFNGGPKLELALTKITVLVYATDGDSHGLVASAGELVFGCKSLGSCGTFSNRCPFW